VSSKASLWFLSGLMAATAVYTVVFYVQMQRHPEVEAETAVIVTPATPFPPAPVPAALKTPLTKKFMAARAAPVAKFVPVPAPAEQARVEAPINLYPPVPLDPPVPPPAPVPAPVEGNLDLSPALPRAVTIASATLVTVRLSEAVSTDNNQPGDTFFATLDQPLVIDGLIIAEKGARCTGRVVDAVEAGRVKGLARLSLELTSLTTSDGQKIELRTARFQKEGPASKAKDVQKVGIGAAIGAAIGAIAGGGKGAAIGAASGGAAGGGVAAARRGKPAMLPAETKISFRMDQPVTITEKR